MAGLCEDRRTFAFRATPKAPGTADTATAAIDGAIDDETGKVNLAQPVIDNCDSNPKAETNPEGAVTDREN